MIKPDDGHYRPKHVVFNFFLIKHIQLCYWLHNHLLVYSQHVESLKSINCVIFFGFVLSFWPVWTKFGTWGDRKPSRSVYELCGNCRSDSCTVPQYSKGKGHPRTGHEGPEREQRYSSTPSLTSALDGVGSQLHAPAALTQERPGTHCPGGWMGPRDRRGKSRPHRASIPGPSNP